MADVPNGVHTTPAETAARLREREHAIRNEVFALTLPSDPASEEVARRRDELERQLARTREQLTRAEKLIKRARERIRAT